MTDGLLITFASLTKILISETIAYLLCYPIMTGPEVIIIGAGPSGIALGHTLKHKLGFADFTVSHCQMEQ